LSRASQARILGHDTFAGPCCRFVLTIARRAAASSKPSTTVGNVRHRNPDHPFTRGVICGKVREYAERVHSPLRVLTPLRRVGPKGTGQLVPISWEEAVATIAERWRAIIARDGAEAILPFSYAGSMGQVQYYAGHPLFHALGASRLDRSICVTTAYAGWRATVGAVTGNDSEQMVGADLVVLWGVNASYSTST
jgi:anaerobic selenocysteine-containing dehydrogenase